MLSKKNLRNILLILVTLLFIVVIKYGLIISNYKEAKYELGFSNWTSSMPPFHSSTSTVEFVVDGSREVELKLWWEGMSGDVEFIVFDELKNEIYKACNKKEHSIRKLNLDDGKYSFRVKQNNFTGALAIGYENLTVVRSLDDKFYTIVSANPDKGFNWEYIIYVPELVKSQKLLVVPNNTGYVTDNYNIHREEAKSLIKYKSSLAKELGVPLLVPVFPRPEMEGHIYTHSLDRNSIYTELESIKRLDNQLIQMIKDSKEVFSSKGLNIESKILMSGFSASGDFVDRFVVVHPDLVEAASFGGSDTIIPLKELKGEKLPYPIGIYDYEKITGKSFNIEILSSVQKFIYKGSEDGGGWQTTNENGNIVRYVWKDYYEKYLLPELKEKANYDNMSLVDNIKLSDDDLDLIKFKAFDGKILIDRFKLVAEIYNGLGIEKTEFKIYEGVEHTITDAMKQDELEFFRDVLNN